MQWERDAADCQAYLGISQAANRDALAYIRTGNQIGACSAAQTSLHELLIAQEVCRGVGNAINEMIAGQEQVVHINCDDDSPRVEQCVKALHTLGDTDALFPRQTREVACQSAKKAQELLGLILTRCPEAATSLSPRRYDEAIEGYCAVPTPARAKKGATVPHVHKPAVAHPTAHPGDPR